MNIMVKRKRIITLLSVICILALVVIVCIVAIVSKPKDKTPKTYSICYHVGDAINKTLFSTSEVDENYVLEELNNYPKCNNTYFCGWYLDDNYMIPAQFPITVTANVDLYAKYLQGNVSANNIAYNRTEMIYYVFGSIDNATDTLVIPDVYNDGVHGVKAVAHLDPSCSISNNPTIASLYVGNEIDEIPSGFAQNNINLTDLVLGQSVMTIDGTAFGGCTNLANINLGDPTQWQIGDDDNSSSGGWYEELGLNTTTITTSLAVTWIRKAVYVIVYNIAINPNVSTQYIGETQLNTFNSNTDNFYNADTLWNGVELRKKVEISKKQNENINLNEKVPMPYASNAYFDGWKYLPDGAEDIAENYIEVPDTMTISNSMTIYASYLKGTIASSAYKYQNGPKNFHIIVSSSSDLVVDANSLIIPDYYNNGNNSALVEEFDNNHSYNKDNIDNITIIYIGHEMNYIGYYAFRQLSNVKSVKLGCKIKSLAQAAFANCSSLLSVTIPNSVKNIGSDVFRRCTSLISITIPDSVTNIGDSAFYGCSALTNVVLSNNLMEIGVDVFDDCTSLVCNNYDNAKYIGSNNNQYLLLYASIDKNITSVKINNSAKFIHSYALSGCTKLTSITIPDNIIGIGNRAFANCSGLGNIAVSERNVIYRSEGNCIIEKTSNTIVLGCKNSVISDSVRSIGEAAFCGCSGLTSLIIPNSVTSIGAAAFYGCSGLASIVIPNSVTSTGSNLFYNCSNLANVTLSNNMTRLNYLDFYGCNSLTSISIPASVISIANNAFQDCNSLANITVSSENTVYRSEGNCIIEKTSNSLLLGCNNSVIPEGVASIGSYAFHDCRKLTSITIPNSVTSIGASAFFNCGKLTSVTFADPDGWKAGSVDMTGKLTDPATNATYLVTTYRNAIWQRS